MQSSPTTIVTPVVSETRSDPSLEDFSPRSRQFPKTRQHLFQRLQVILTFSNGAHFALAIRP